MSKRYQPPAEPDPDEKIDPLDSPSANSGWAPGCIILLPRAMGILLRVLVGRAWAWRGGMR